MIGAIRIRALGIGVLAIAAMNLVGCADDTQAVGSMVAKQPRVATAEELIARYNQLVNMEPTDVRAIFALFIAENEVQERMLQAIDSAMPLYELDALMRGEYATPFRKSPIDAFYGFPMQNARLVGFDDTRAQADLIDCNHRPLRLHLVKDRRGWWISGETFESDQRLKETFDRGEWLGMDGTMSAAAAVAPDIIRRIRDGEFHSGRQAQQAIEAALRGK